MLGTWGFRRPKEEGSSICSEEDWYYQQRAQATWNYMPEEGKFILLIYFRFSDHRFELF